MFLTHCFHAATRFSERKDRGTFRILQVCSFFTVGLRRDRGIGLLNEEAFDIALTTVCFCE